MLKKILFAASLASLQLPAAAMDWTGNIRQIITCTDTWFELELVNKTMPHGGTNKQIRYMVKQANVGTEKFKQIYAMSLTAFAVQTPVWIGTPQATATTSVSGGNCGVNNMPAQEVTGMGTYR